MRRAAVVPLSPGHEQMSLSKYRRKRSAARTPEPFGREVAGPASVSGGTFVIQKHAARRLHYDFRLEMEGVLRSWAVPKGPSLNPADKHLAVAVEDHPLEYGDFEGVIPPGNYGAGSVIVWDRGVYEVIDPVGGDAAEAVRNGKIDIALHGFKLNGAYTLVRTGGRRNADPKDKQNWLLIKKRDQYSTATENVLGDASTLGPVGPHHRGTGRCAGGGAPCRRQARTKASAGAR